MVRSDHRQIMNPASTCTCDDHFTSFFFMSSSLFGNHSNSLNTTSSYEQRQGLICFQQHGRGFTHTHIDWSLQNLQSTAQGINYTSFQSGLPFGTCFSEVMGVFALTMWMQKRWVTAYVHVYYVYVYVCRSRANE